MLIKIEPRGQKFACDCICNQFVMARPSLDHCAKRNHGILAVLVLACVLAFWTWPTAQRRSRTDEAPGTGSPMRLGRSDTAAPAWWNAPWCAAPRAVGYSLDALAQECQPFGTLFSNRGEIMPDHFS